ncbi:Phospho-2-dehydro-3-deoxyheptonate aldolase, Phe-sensitive [Hydrogenophaga sp. T4]|nr:Phospho-2-dehydro-3-deoxyheptonate aldolase, Phe-sensitive [Hydrogenophaga sp. T4]
MVDCSHANSSKQHEKQLDVARDIAAQIAGGSRSVFGVMIESHIEAGAQKFTPGKDDVSKLAYGQSITDAAWAGPIRWRRWRCFLRPCRARASGILDVERGGGDCDAPCGSSPVSNGAEVCVLHARARCRGSRPLIFWPSCR